MTLRTLAYVSGRAYATLTDISAGKTMPGIDTIEILARALGVSPGWLAYGQGPTPEWAEEEFFSVKPIGPQPKPGKYRV